MITTDPFPILNALRSGKLTADAPSVPKGVFLVEPVNFRLSEDSAQDNHYMNLGVKVDPDQALEQYIELLSIIRNAGVPAKSFPGDPKTPDDLFPNNVFGTAPGRFIIGHMLHPSRQQEAVRKDIRGYFHDLGYQAFDLSQQDCIAELTGPLVIDRARRLGFCGMSERVDAAGVLAMHQAFDLRHTLQFDLAAGEYHTNVVMAVLAGRACVLHADSIDNAIVRRAIADIYNDQVMYLNQAEKNAFAGNCIALTKNDVFMSQTAADALRPINRALLDFWGFRIHAARLDEIEKAGGSLRCMVAEIF